MSRGNSPTSDFRLPTHSLALTPSLARWVGVLAALLLAGCNTDSVTTHSTSGGGQVAVRGTDDLTQAFDSLRKVAAGGGHQAQSRSLYYLNQWLNGGRSVEGTWEPDPMQRNSIPRALKSAPSLATLHSFEFRHDDPLDFLDKLSKEFAQGPSNRAGIDAAIAAYQRDMDYLQQHLWLHDIASRVRREPPPAQLAPWIKQVETSVGLPESEQLAAAERLFDWTIRNVQLEPLPPLPAGPAATAGEGTDPISPAMLGQVGPGYGHLPIQLLLQGRGDAHERGRLFLLLCRQAGIDAVMIGRIDETVSSAPQPWVAAVLAGQELYLFDPALGLPIPGPDRQGIATLSQVLGDPAVLAQLDVPGGPAYEFTPDKLKNLVALIEAEPESLARRFHLLQDALPSSRRLVLATDPSRLEPRLRQARGIGGVSLWRVPYEALLYQIGRQNVLAGSRELQIQFQREEQLFVQPDTPLILGRNLHLQGRFDARDQLPGARTYYLQARLPDDVRDKIYESAEFRRLIGFHQPLPEDEEQRREVLETMVTTMQRAKQYASYWMGLTYFETGRHEAAVEWLDLRTLEAPLPTPLAPSARYNLARAYEALGQTEKAIALYRADDSPQRHGNLLRAQWLGQ